MSQKLAQGLRFLNCDYKPAKFWVLLQNLTLKFANFEAKPQIWPVYSHNLENLRPQANFLDFLLQIQA